MIYGSMVYEGVECMKFCSKCGKEIAEGQTVCPNCGEQTQPNIVINNNINTGGRVSIRKREIVTSIILSFVTCGIYSIIWFIYLTDDVNAASEETGTSGGVAFLLTLITCGIYGFYWAYTMGKKMQIAGEKRGVSLSDNSVLYIILQLFGLGIVNYCLIQNDLNRLAD